MWNSILPLPSLSNQVFSGNSEVELSFVSSFAPVKNNQFKLWQFPFFKKINQPTLEKPTNNNPPSPPVLCNIKWSVPVQELPAPSGTLGKGQLRAQHSSRAREGWGEPGSSFPCVPGKAGAWLEGLLRGSFLSPCCCHAGRYLGPGRKRRKKKNNKQHSVYWTNKVFVQQLDAVFRDCVQSCSSQYSDCAGRYSTNPTVLSPTWPASVAFFISHLSPGYVLFSCSSDEKNMWAGKESRERIIWIYLMK